MMHRVDYRLLNGYFVDWCTFFVHNGLELRTCRIENESLGALVFFGLSDGFLVTFCFFLDFDLFCFFELNSFEL